MHVLSSIADFQAQKGDERKRREGNAFLNKMLGISKKKKKEKDPESGSFPPSHINLITFPYIASAYKAE